MTANTLTILLQIAGLMHLGLLMAGFLMPSVVGLRRHLAPLPNFVRQLFWVYYFFIGLCLISFGSLTFTLAATLARGGALARAFCIFLTAFWILRLFAATFVFDLRPYLTSPWRKAGFHLTNVAFIYLPIVYALAAWKGGAP